MTWPPQATRAEVLRILEINRDNFHHWVISREETTVLIGLLRDEDIARAVEGERERMATAVRLSEGEQALGRVLYERLRAPGEKAR